MAIPAFTDKLSVVALTKLSAGGTARGTLNISSKFAGWLFIRVGRLTTTAPATGVKIYVRRILYDGANSRDIPHPGSIAFFQDSTTAANLTTLNGTPTFPGAALTLTSATGFAADQTVCVVDSVSSPTRAEWHHTSKIASTTLTMDRNFANTGIVSGDTITNQAMVFAPVWVDGTPGSGDIEVIFDYGPESNASTLVVECWAQSYDSVG